ncbi:Hypothetical protein SMAX5B_021368 [Scophthalmus maximus]|uniref:Uncharacterized protein n=1 Tax=Scophthalmus maximus TaxID=52904 RepID=A0A2U9CBB1_SCOMX|nr:Hypothetical protein SMAX5B_021368 [Scophthalmus maximus]
MPHGLLKKQQKKERKPRPLDPRTDLRRPHISHLGAPESSDPDLVSIKQLIQVQHSNQAVHKHLSLRPEVHHEMTLVQENLTNLHEQIQDPEEGQTSQEPHSVPDLEEIASSGLTSRHLLHDALQQREQMNTGYQETHASSLATPFGPVSNFIISDNSQTSPPACLMDMGAPQPRDAPRPILSPTSLRSERRDEDCWQLECTTRVRSVRGYEDNANILVPGNLDGDERQRFKVTGKPNPKDAGHLASRAGNTARGVMTKSTPRSAHFMLSLPA